MALQTLRLSVSRRNREWPSAKRALAPWSCLLPAVYAPGCTQLSLMQLNPLMGILWFSIVCIYPASSHNVPFVFAAISALAGSVFLQISRKSLRSSFELRPGLVRYIVPLASRWLRPPGPRTHSEQDTVLLVPSRKLVSLVGAGEDRK